MTEFVQAFGAPLPMTMIADQFGGPRTARAQFKKWSGDLADRLIGMLNREQLERAGANVPPLVAAFICVGNMLCRRNERDISPHLCAHGEFSSRSDNDVEHHGNLPLGGTHQAQH